MILTNEEFDNYYSGIIHHLNNTKGRLYDSGENDRIKYLLDLLNSETIIINPNYNDGHYLFSIKFISYSNNLYTYKYIMYPHHRVLIDCKKYNLTINELMAKLYTDGKGLYYHWNTHKSALKLFLDTTMDWHPGYLAGVDVYDNILNNYKLINLNNILDDL